MTNLPTLEQSAIVASSSRILAIDAVAGSGKTTTLSFLAKNAYEKGVPPHRIRCLSFSTSAKKRLVDKFSEQGVPRAVLSQTVVEFARHNLDILIDQKFLDRPRILYSTDQVRKRLIQACNTVWQRYEGRSDSDFDFAIENNTERLAQILQILERLKATLTTHRFNDDEFDRSELYEIAENLDVPIEAIEICFAHERIRQPMTGEFEWQTESDFVPDLVQTLKMYSSAVDASPALSLILIDEWHDVNASEFELIKLLKRNARLIVVGDRDQVINESRGAELKFSTSEFDNAYTDAKRLPLRKTRRFGASLSRQASRHISRLCESIEGLHTVMHKLYYDPTVANSCASRVAKHIKVINEEDHSVKLSDIAVIVREEDQSIELENIFLDQNIPYQCEGLSSYLHRPEILLLRALLHVVSGEFSTLEKDSLTCSKMVTALAMYVSMSTDPNDWDAEYHEEQTKKNSKNILEQAKQFITADPSTLVVFFDAVLCKEHDFDLEQTKRWKQRLSKFVKSMAIKKEYSNAADFLRTANTMLDLPAATRRAFLRRSQADSATRSIRHFIDFADKFQKYGPKEFLEELSNRQMNVGKKTAASRTRSQLTLTTIAAAKGQEWRHVILPFLQLGEFPRGSDIKEEKRFLYVAMTRAKDSLAIAEPDDEHKNYRSPLLHGSSTA